MSSKYKIILTDCDGVLLDWENGFNEWMTSKGYTKVVEGIYDISKTYGLEKAVGKRLVKEYNESAWMGYLKAFRDARSGVAKLYEAGYRFHCITSLSLDKKAKRLRMQNLENVFGKGVFKELVCLDTGADKDEALAEYEGSGFYWLEDKTENAECGLKFGLKSILIHHPHNVDCDNPDVIVCDDWSAIVDEILG
jgi:phosphoglycolate phosphatase-like HAD superfamily hydrolase